MNPALNFFTFFALIIGIVYGMLLKTVIDKRQVRHGRIPDYLAEIKQAKNTK